jgi:hypothetical protein
LNWEHAGRHPLYHVVQDHNTKNGIVVSAPKKDKSFQSCFGRSANNNMMQSTVMTSTMMSKKN